VNPGDNRTALDEIRELISTSEGRLGDVYRLTQQGLSPEQIAAELDVATHGFVYSYRYQTDAALYGKKTTGSVQRSQTLGALNVLVGRGRGLLSPEALELLLANRAAVEAPGLETDFVAEAKADVEEKVAALSTLEDLNKVSGIYAFSYGWYLDSPVDAARGNTLIKVGMAVDVADRIRSHTAGTRTHMPEPLVLVRVYSADSDDLRETEKTFHELLDTAGHENPRRRGPSKREVGKEWFLTNEDFLDGIARALKLRTLYIGRSEFSGE
jgi:T5orf172 domain